ncbi:MAG: YdeI/OmpD-associated family protein [Pyrinomonadaceae bacterium]
MSKIKTVDEFFENTIEWKAEILKLRDVMLKSGLVETLKWGHPTYTHNGKNIASIGVFKSYVGLWFFQGALLKDEAGVLINAQEGKTKAQRQWRMDSAKAIKPRQILAYISEAVANEEAGKAIKPERKPLVVPAELESALKKNKKLESAFEALSLSCKREYCEYVGEAKREETRERRLEKILPMILGKKGLNDRYR